MYYIYGLLIVVFTLALMANPFGGDGWYWELGNGLGFVCFAALLYLTLEGRSAGGGRSKYHRRMGYLVLFTLLAHSFWFLLGDPIVIEYLKIGAPAYMVLGFFALALCIVLVLSSVMDTRKKAYQSHISFRIWHRYLAFILLAMAGVHIGLSGFYLENIFQTGLFTLLVIAVIFTPLAANKNYLRHVQIKANTNRIWIKLSLVCCIVLTLFMAFRTGFSE